MTPFEYVFALAVQCCLGTMVQLGSYFSIYILITFFKPLHTFTARLSCHPETLMPPKPTPSVYFKTSQAALSSFGG